MKVRFFNNRESMSEAAAGQAAASIRRAIERKGQARVIAATGASQLQFLSALTRRSDVDWRRVELFHLDEYIGFPPTHPSSFRKYLLDHLINKTGIERYHFLDGEDEPSQVCRTVGAALASDAVDVAFLGIGENGHLAFNDPPADFDTPDPYIVVTLDAACRRQQVGEGWFASVNDVPEKAITMSIAQILRANELVVVVPDRRKAAAVKATLEGEITPAVPASILRTHVNATLFVDEAAASLLHPATRARYDAEGS